MARKTLVGVLKTEGAVGSVITGSLNRYVVVEETPNGVYAICLDGTVFGVPNMIFQIPDGAIIYVVDKEYYKENFSKRWQEIAQIYPAIG